MDIRALFPIPSLTMHFVMSEESGAATFDDLKGKTILLGKGSFGAREGEKYLGLFGVKDEVSIADVELSNAVPALKNGQIDGFVTAGSWPAPNVVEAAASTERRRAVADRGADRGDRAHPPRHPGGHLRRSWTHDIVTTSLPVVAYTTTAMDDETAYQLTRTYWSQKAAMAEDAGWWRGVTGELLGNITGRIHPGALRYYEEAGMRG
ncbi:MAG: TAXI family TRAP transporter solute-binding subunit [Halofilum sp. (in: g-proteobacteria)]|nr:TAXI family TRAP transporter solute-binding subunit [Halofilum sp. (in: g-proteobacteria)]